LQGLIVKHGGKDTTKIAFMQAFRQKKWDLHIFSAYFLPTLSTLPSLSLQVCVGVKKGRGTAPP
jgi:hypothetical protein